jgi:hypothetical protein
MGGGGLKDVHPDAPADPSPDPASDATSFGTGDDA